MLILASQSPRRREILKRYDYRFKAISPQVDESLIEKTSPHSFVETLAFMKANAVFMKHSEDVVVAADTIVYMDQRFYEKPKDREDAINMLTELSGKTHQVYTGICILASNHQDVFHTIAHVTFHKLTKEMIIEYVDTHKPYDKAGSYGIQEQQGSIVKSHEGDYLTIVGFPMSTIKPKLDIVLKKKND
jgi:septum formation protein